jgi:hypothetical protein
MFFSRLAMFFSIVLFLIGVVSVLLGSAAAAGILDEATRARYLVRSPDQIIIGGAYFVLAAVALGTLAEISSSMRSLVHRSISD